MQFHNGQKMIGHQDGVGFDFTNTLQTLTKQLVGEGKFLLVPCQGCESQASVRLNVKKVLQTLACTWCKHPMKIRILPGGIYKIKSAMGIEEVNGEERRWINRTL